MPRPRAGTAPPARGSAYRSRRLDDDDLVGQQGMPVGQIEHGLMGKLLGVVGARSALKDDSVVGINDMEVANSAIRDAIDMPLDELGDFLMTLADVHSESLGPEGLIGIPCSHFDRLDLGGESTSDAGAEQIHWERRLRNQIESRRGLRADRKVPKWR